MVGAGFRVSGGERVAEEIDRELAASGGSGLAHLPTRQQADTELRRRCSPKCPNESR
jgi:hypothetical protein